jgi:heme/copper-type cytochrome/quinol oxidase subunit 4
MSAQISTAVATSFEAEFEKFTAERRQVSDRMYGLLHALVAVMTACSIAFAAFYATQLGESFAFKAVIALAAVGVECSLVFFAAVMYPRPVLQIFGAIAGIGVVAISIFTAASFLLSQQYGKDNETTEARKAYVAKLQASLERMDVTAEEDRGTIARLNDRIERGLDSLKGVKGSKATAIYHDIAQALGYPVEVVSLWIRLFWALVFVSIAVALASYLEIIYCPKSLGRWVDELKRRETLLADARRDFQHIALAPSSTSSPDSDTETDSAGESTPARWRRKNRGNGAQLPEKTYQEVKLALQSGRLIPTVDAIKGVTRGTDDAYQAIDRLMGEGVIFQAANGRYRRANGHAEG